MLVTADRLDDTGEPANCRLAELLRTYVNIQTYVRTSSPIPTDMADRFTELQSDYKIEPRKYVQGNFYNNHYTNPLGPFYLNIEADMQELANNLQWLSEEPVRNITISDCIPGKDLGLILRNYRVDAAYSLHLRFRRRTMNVRDVADALRVATLSMCNRITITGLDDRLKIVQMGFLMGNKIRKGCELFMGANYRTPGRVAVKK